MVFLATVPSTQAAELPYERESEPKAFTKRLPRHLNRQVQYTNILSFTATTRLPRPIKYLPSRPATSPAVGALANRNSNLPFHISLIINCHPAHNGHQVSTDIPAVATPPARLDSLTAVHKVQISASYILDIGNCLHCSSK